MRFGMLSKSVHVASADAWTPASKESFIWHAEPPILRVLKRSTALAADPGPRVSLGGPSGSVFGVVASTETEGRELGSQPKARRQRSASAGRGPTPRDEWMAARGL